MKGGEPMPPSAFGGNVDDDRGEGACPNSGADAGAALGWLQVGI